MNRSKFLSTCALPITTDQRPGANCHQPTGTQQPIENERSRSSPEATMSPWKTLLAATATLVTLLAAGATVETTCRAAAGVDARVDGAFCVSELSKHRDSPGADAWGLAKVAANLGVNNAGGAVREAEALLLAATTDAKERALLGQCRRLYFDSELAFAGAYDEINARAYAAGKEMAAEAAALAQRCDGVFAEAGIPSPLARRGEYAVKIAVVCTAITDLIK
ncbi:hypothetical protein BS78_04G154000 [Paspalum vaginatum]|nr:hypothetical protein BS78_04G154000 [Paspalum vaginatum]